MLLFKLIQLLFENPLHFLIFFIVLTVPLLISITIHEWAHGFAAYKFGDNTPKYQGRLSLNPFKHLDPVGTLMLFIIGIGWAKPVEIDPGNINGRFKLLLVAFAGPFSNFVMAVLFTFIYYLIYSLSGIKAVNNDIVALVLFLLGLIVRINLALGMFNLIPVPPLDGANIVRNLLPENLSEAYFKMAPYGMTILLVLMFTGAISRIFDAADIVRVYLLKVIILIFDPVLKMFF